MADKRLGLDVGGTKSAVIVGTSEGDIIAREAWPTLAERGPDAMIDQMIEQACQQLAEHPEIEGVGVAIGGPLDCERGIVYEPPNLPGWKAILLKDRLADALGLPVTVEHDAAACALAEVKWGAGKSLGDKPTLVYLTCGTGFGAGMVLRGEVWHGAGGRSPEVGHVRLADVGPTAFGKQGSAEAFCAGSSLPRIAAWLFPERWENEALGGRDLMALIEQDDVDAQAVMTKHAHMTGRVCAMLGDLLLPDVIVLGSLAVHLGERWVTQVRESFQAEVLPIVTELTNITPSPLGPSLQDLSALAVARA